MRRSALKSLPVVMNHYVNESGWRMTLSPACFESQCRALAERGYRGIGLDEAEAYLLDGEPLPEKSLLLTFDDGYLDNYFYALPALHHYGHQAVSFPVANRIEQTDTPRASVEDALSGRAPVPPLVANALTRTAQGFVLRRDLFLNRGEIRAMEASRVFQVGAHSLGHYGVFTSPRFKDFFRPRDQYRTFYRTEQEPIWGLPDFPVKPGLRFRAFLPNPDLVDAVKGLVPQEFDAAADFFAEPENPRALRSLVDGFRSKMGRYESDSERTERMWREIGEGKARLEGILGRPVRSLCWPYGRYCREAHRIAMDAGFKVFFVVLGGANPPGRPLAVHRFEGREKPASWLADQAGLHSRPLLANLLALLGM